MWKRLLKHSDVYCVSNFVFFSLFRVSLEVLDSARAHKKKEKETGKQEDDIVKRKKFPSFPSTFLAPKEL